jgi:hypothetical protein
MLTPGEYGDVLRAVGRMLDSVQARAAEITEQATSLHVSWQSAGGERVERVFNSEQLDVLRGEEHALRDASASPPFGGHGELLRTLGQSLDQQGISLERVVELADGYRVTGTVGARYISQWYGPDVLHGASERRRSLRNAPIPVPRAVDPGHLSRRPGRPP